MTVAEPQNNTYISCSLKCSVTFQHNTPLFTVASFFGQWHRSREEGWGESPPPTPNKKYPDESIFSPSQILAIFRTPLCPECVCGRGSTPDPTGGANSTLPDPLAHGRRLAAHPPRTPPKISAFSLYFWPFAPLGLIRQ